MKSLLLVIFVAAACEHGQGGPVDGFPGPGDGGSGISCGGFAGTQCPSTEFCDFATNTCGATDESGVCHTRPNDCPDVFQPVCGCDGMIHGNSCDAAAAGADLNANGTCTTQQGQFVCGFAVCQTSGDFCQHSSSDVGGEPDGFACLPLPQGCGATPSCSCLAGEPCGSLCSGDAVNGLTLICPGG